MSKKFRLLLVLSLVLASCFLPASAYAVDDASSGAACEAIKLGGGTCSEGESEAKGVLSGLMGDIVSILLWAVGVAAIIVLLLGAYRYTTSGGDANKLKGAKDTIIYALIGIAVAVLAQVIINIALSVDKEPPEPPAPSRGSGNRQLPV